MSGAFSSNNVYDYRDLKIGKELGVGGFAIVYEAILKGKTVAVKQLQINESQLENNTKFSDYFGEFRREVWLMSGMHHENIVSLEGICNKPLCMILEYCDAGNLFHWARKKGQVMNANDMMEREKYALDIAKGMSFLHSTNPPIIHRDLKSPNVLLKKSNGPYLTAKIADFGLSRGLVWNKDLVGKVVDNPVWLAPEILKGLPYTEKVDVYAFGIICWELIAGRDFKGQESFLAKMEDQIIRGDREEIPDLDFIPEYYKYIINVCWDGDHEKRPSFDQVKQKLIEHNSVAGGLEAEPPKMTLSLTYESIINGGTDLNQNNNGHKEENKGDLNLLLTDLPQDVGPISFSLGTRGRVRGRGSLVRGRNQNN